MEYDLFERRMGIWILVLSVAAWAAAQLIKLLLTYCREHRLDLDRALGSGGMPSSHSAFVCACASATGRLCGWSSVLFAITAVIAIVVMYDAANIRQAAGEHAKILNYMMDQWAEKGQMPFGTRLKELLGHTPVQVLAGAVLGTAIGLLGAYFVV
ncbi:divergent PAP2 family protein [Intestinimonas butyriciproducens]|nr:divergent PAP2 family protein [Intestinimonas butyriciproducens]